MPGSKSRLSSLPTRFLGLSLTTATRNQLCEADTKCHLLELPAELRNRIYSYVAADHCRDDKALKGRRCRRPALLAVNEQVQTEFASLYYSAEFFRISIFDPRTMEWTDVSDRHLIEGIRERKFCTFENGPRSARNRTLEWARFCARGDAGASNMLTGILDVAHVGGGRGLFLELPFSVLGPCFEEERVMRQRSRFSDDGDDDELV